MHKPTIHLKKAETMMIQSTLAHAAATWSFTLHPAHAAAIAAAHITA
jgi:hypothetical protein